MGKYENIGVSDFFEDALKRFDGKVAIAITVAAIMIAIIAPIFDMSLGKRVGGRLSMTIIMFVPVFFIYYASLVYHSTQGKLSVYINSIFLLAVPVLFVYFLR
jgi:hypothetical protein